MSSFTVEGNLARDPQFFKGDDRKKDRVVFTVMESYGERGSEVAHAYLVTAWGYMARNVAESLKKGSAVVVVGHLSTYVKVVQIDGSDVNMTQIALNARSVGVSLRFGTASFTRESREVPVSDDF